MDQIDMIESFAAVARHKGFSAAARHLGQPLATVSRKVSALEAKLGAQLLVRTTRTVRLTKAGSRYLEQVLPLVEAFSDINDSVTKGIEDVSGELTITSPVLFGARNLAPVVCQFLSEFPNTTIRHLMSDQCLDYVESGIDLGLRIGNLTDSSFKMMNLGHVRVLTCASPEYLSRWGNPKTPEAMCSHRTVAYGPYGERSRWTFHNADGLEQKIDIGPVYKADTTEAMIQFAVSGGGIGKFYSYQVADLIQEGKLTILLAEFEPPVRPVCFLYPEANYLPRLLREFLDFSAPKLRSRLREVLDKLRC